MKRGASRAKVSNLGAYMRETAPLQEKSSETIQHATGDDAVALLDVQNPDVVFTTFAVRRANFREAMERLEKVFDIDAIDVRVVKVEENTGHGKHCKNALNSGLVDLDLSQRVFVAKIDATLKSERPAPPSVKESTIQIKNLMINITRHQVFLSGKQIDLTKTEFKILHFLAQKPGWAFTRAEILHGIHGREYYVGQRAVNVCIRYLRRKLGDAGYYIETVRDVGYRMRDFGS